MVLSNPQSCLNVDASGSVCIEVSPTVDGCFAVTISVNHPSRGEGVVLKTEIAKETRSSIEEVRNLIGFALCRMLA